MILYVKPERQTCVRMALGDLREMEFKMDCSGASVLYMDSSYQTNK